MSGPRPRPKRRPMRKLTIAGLALRAMAVAAPVAQAATAVDKIAGSGVWTSPGGAFGTPTVSVNASEKKDSNKFTFDYKNGLGGTIYLVQGSIAKFQVTAMTSSIVGKVTKEQGIDPRDAILGSPQNRFAVGQYVPIRIDQVASRYHFNFGPGQATEPALWSIGAPDLSFDPGTAQFSIVDG